MNYNGEYVRMSDIDVFSEEYREQYYSSLGELGVEVFANESDRDIHLTFLQV